MTKKKIHLIRKDDSHLTICGVPIHENDSDFVTKSRINVTCINCRNRMEEELFNAKAIRYFRGHNRNQTNLEDMF